MKKPGNTPDKAVAVSQSQVRAAQRKKKRLTVMVLLSSIAIVLAIGWAWRHHQQTVAGPEGGACSTSILKQAAANLDPSKQSQLQIIASHVRSIHNYQRDPNCLYIVLTSSINSGDAIAARTDLDQLQKVYNARAGFSTSLGFTKDLSLLQSNVAFMEKSAKQAESQTQSFNNPQ